MLLDKTLPMHVIAYIEFFRFKLNCITYCEQKLIIIKGQEFTNQPYTYCFNQLLSTWTLNVFIYKHFIIKSNPNGYIWLISSYEFENLKIQGQFKNIALGASKTQFYKRTWPFFINKNISKHKSWLRQRSSKLHVN